MPEPYVPQSRLLAELMARRHNPVQSIGQGLADVAGDVGEAYFIKKAAEKEAEKKQGDAADLARQLLMSADPNTGTLDNAAAMGYNAPAQQAFPQGQTSAAAMLAQAMQGQPARGQQAQEAFRPMDPNQRASFATQQTARTNPQVALQGMGQAYEWAQRTAPPKPRYFNAPDIGVMKDDNGELSVAQPVPAKAPDVDPDIEIALWVNGGDKQKAADWLKKIKTPKTEGGPAAPAGYRYTSDGVNLEPIPGGPADKANAPTVTPPTGYRYTPDGKSLEPIPGGPAEIGRAGLPQAYREQESAYTQLDGALTEYEALVKEYGTESWNVTAQTKMKNLEKQITLAIKDIAKTGTLDEGTITFMDGLIPDATSFLANANVVNGKTKALANASSLRGYSTRGREALSKAYNVPLAAQGSEASPPPAGVSPEEWAGMTPEEKATFK